MKVKLGQATGRVSLLLPVHVPERIGNDYLAERAASAVGLGTRGSRRIKPGEKVRQGRKISDEKRKSAGYVHWLLNEGWKPKAIADAIGLDRGFVSNIANGRSCKFIDPVKPPDFDTMVKS